jgi:hypothetical protein
MTTSMLEIKNAYAQTFEKIHCIYYVQILIDFKFWKKNST